MNIIFANNSRFGIDKIDCKIYFEIDFSDYRNREFKIDCENFQN